MDVFFYRITWKNGRNSYKRVNLLRAKDIASVSRAIEHIAPRHASGGVMMEMGKFEVYLPLHLKREKASLRSRVAKLFGIKKE